MATCFPSSAVSAILAGQTIADEVGYGVEGGADAAVADVEGEEAAGVGEVCWVNGMSGQSLSPATLRATVEQGLQISHPWTICRCC